MEKDGTRKTNTSCGNDDGDRKLGRRKGQRSGGIFKHDVAITSDQSGIFHPAPFIRRKRERRRVVQLAPPSLRSTSPPVFVRIINGQFVASAADCIVSLFSGPPSVGWLAVFPLSRILSRPSTRIQAASLPPRRVVFPFVLPPQSTLRLFPCPHRCVAPSF